MICTMLHRIRSVPLDIWLVERCVCFWPSCLSGATGSFTVVTFSSLYACISLSDSCFWSVLCVCQIFFNNMPSFFAVCLRKLCQHFPKVAFLDWYTFLIKVLSPLLSGMLHYQYAVTALKIDIENKILCFCLQKPEMYLVINII